jgi:hypothetical protein
VLQIVLWKWEQPGFKRPYSAEHVNVMCAMLRRNLQGTPHRIVCVTDRPDGIMECETAHIWDDCHDLPNASGRHLPSCYRRLKLYDPETQKYLGIDRGDRIMGIDLDTLITGHLRDIVRLEGRYIGWQLKGAQHPKVFNGSLQIFTAGDLEHVWKDFNPATSPKAALAAGFRGSDQAWLSFQLVGKPGSVGLEWPEVASYPLQNRIQGILKRETKIIFFHGSEKPWSPNARFHTPWIERYWRL